MKKIVVRSIRVALVLAILCVIIELMIYKAGWYVLLLFPVVVLLDASDSMLVWRLKRITLSRSKTCLIYTYLGITGLAVCSLASAFYYRVEPVAEKPYMLVWMLYSMFVTIFSFGYFVIVVRVMARHMD